RVGDRGRLRGREVPGAARTHPLLSVGVYAAHDLDQAARVGCLVVWREVVVAREARAIDPHPTDAHAPRWDDVVLPALRRMGHVLERTVDHAEEVLEGLLARL